MSEGCTHDCSSCSENCSSRQEKESLLESLNVNSSIKKVIGVVSGKGGVGKSMVTSMLASIMARRGHRTCILDADITGPSIPKVLGIEGRAKATEEYIIPSLSKGGIEVMSVNLLLNEQTAPVLWRGPVIAGAVKQFWTDVLWEDEEFMFVDMPPGTGDVALTVFQSIPVDGIIIVTSPQQLVSMIVKKAINMANMMNVPVLGIVENMSYFECPDCGGKHYIFGKSALEEIAKENNIALAARLPLKPELAAMADEGDIESFEGDWLDKMGDELEKML